MSVNFKAINEVPEITSLADGDKLLVNSGGMAKQIDASKVGGSGGGSAPVYLEGNFDASLTAQEFVAYKDAAHTQPMTYDEGVAAMKNGAVWSILFEGVNTFFYPMYGMDGNDIGNGNTVALSVTFGAGLRFDFTIKFSDT